MDLASLWSDGSYLLWDAAILRKAPALVGAWSAAGVRREALTGRFVKAADSLPELAAVSGVTAVRLVRTIHSAAILDCGLALNVVRPAEEISESQRERRRNQLAPPGQR